MLPTFFILGFDKFQIISKIGEEMIYFKAKGGEAG
jgi:hypothetical protein